MSDSTANHLEAAVAADSPLFLLNEAEGLLREGLLRIANAQEDLPHAQNPIEEALRLSEEQTMNTLAAIEKAQDALKEIHQAHQVFIDEPLARINSALASILASQQGQDLAGQRLKKSLTLLKAVQDRISRALTELPVPASEMTNNADIMAQQVVDKDYLQNDVDTLLAELGI